MIDDLQTRFDIKFGLVMDIHSNQLNNEIVEFIKREIRKPLKFKMRRIREKKKEPERLLMRAICYWCGAVYSECDHLKEHQIHCSPKNIKARDKRFEHLLSLINE